MTKQCPLCHTTFEPPIAHAEKRYCTQRCAVVHHNQSVEQRHAVTVALTGRDAYWIRGKKLSVEQREIRRKNNLGSKSHFWKGGITKESRVIRDSLQYALWREAVFARDDFRCIDCGVRGGELHPDHLYPFSTHPRLRFVLENGITRCAKCHRKTPTYGSRLNNDPTAHAYTGFIFGH